MRFTLVNIATARATTMPTYSGVRIADISIRGCGPAAVFNYQPMSYETQVQNADNLRMQTGRPRRIFVRRVLGASKSATQRPTSQEPPV